MPQLSLVLVGQWPDGAEAAIQRAVPLINQRRDLPELAGQINLKLVDEATIRALNKSHSGQDKVTDVLSFSYIEDGQAPASGELGDIAIAAPEAARQAARAGTDQVTEVTLLAIHGLLHILGLDHAGSAERVQMDRLQGGLMAALGLTYRDFGWLS